MEVTKNEKIIYVNLTRPKIKVDAGWVFEMPHLHGLVFNTYGEPALVNLNRGQVEISRCMAILMIKHSISSLKETR